MDFDCVIHGIFMSIHRNNSGNLFISSTFDETNQKMENFYCEATVNTPEIKADFSKKEITITGKCYPTNSIEFFLPFRTWFNSFLKTEIDHVKLEFDLEYFNTSSSIVLLEIMKQFNKARVPKRRMVWLYEEEDDDMIEAGNEYNLMIDDQLEIHEKRSVSA